MAIRRINENPKVSDQIVFDILCPDGDDCFVANPYKVDNVKIYYVERDFNSENGGDYTENADSALQEAIREAQEAICLDPSEANLIALQRLRENLAVSPATNTFYYSKATPVLILGTDASPVWLDPDQVPPEVVEETIANNRLTLIDEDADDNTQYGRFELEWTPVGMREGDYFICWTWTPNPGGDSISAHETFFLKADSQLATCIPTHFTASDKYEILLERYLPAMFKEFVCSGDLTPYVLQELNASVAKGFTFVEDMANQMVDMLDANVTNETFLPLLSALFNLKLRSVDPTRWRRQIKMAIPLFKKKGTLTSLTDALDAAGVKLNKFTRLWQVVSKYTWQESFVATEANGGIFTLSKVAILSYDNVEVYYRAAADGSEWTQLTPDYIRLTNEVVTLPSGCTETGRTVTTATWVGDELSVDPVILYAGDFVRVVYQIADVPSEDEQLVENYIRSLDLADQRDERNQEYPLKNWNVRVIEEDDAYFDIVIPTRHPYYDPLFWGWVRTEFPYSENIYNMEEYNGSTRESLNPCDIDKNFLDNCRAGQSSEFNVDLEIEGLSNERLAEVEEIIREYVPFHSLMHSMLIGGGADEYVRCNEELELFIRVRDEDIVISGGQVIFNRIMENGSQFKRDELATVEEVEDWQNGTIENIECILYTPDDQLENIGLDLNNILKVLPPWSGDDVFRLTNPQYKSAVVNDGVPPLTDDSFAFKLYNNRFTSPGAAIYQEYLFSDAAIDFQLLWDTINPDIAYDGTWKLVVPDYPSDDGDEYVIQELGSNLILDYFKHTGCTFPLITTTNIPYSLLDDEDTVLATGTTGVWTGGTRGIVDVSNETGLTNIRNYASIDDYVSYDSTNYKISGFLSDETHRFYIEGYTDGTAVGVEVSILKQLLSSIGYFHYRGLKLTASSNLETSLGIVNGVNGNLDNAKDDSHFKENFLVLIGEDYYTISEIDGDELTLVGPPMDIGFTPETVSFSILRFIKEQGEVTIPERSNWYWPGGTFSVLDRRGNDMIEVHTSETLGLTQYGAAKAANLSKKPKETLAQKESITVKIDWIEEKK